MGITDKKIRMVKGLGVEGEGRGELGVRFDKLNELRDGKVPEPVEGSKGRGRGTVWAQRSLGLGKVPEPVEGCHSERGILLVD